MKPLACWLGRHRWEMRIEQAAEVSVCAACGKELGDGGGSKGDPGGMNTHTWDRGGSNL